MLKYHLDWITWVVSCFFSPSSSLKVFMPDLNGSRWNLPEDIQQRRYRLFWTIFTADTWSVSVSSSAFGLGPFLMHICLLDQSFHYGRPPSLSRAYVDCPLPKDPEDLINANGEREGGCKSYSTSVPTSHVLRSHLFFSSPLDMAIHSFHACHHGRNFRFFSACLQHHH